MKLAARKHKLKPGQIRQWRKNIQETTRLASMSPKKLSINHGKKLENAELEETVYIGILKQREEELAISTLNIINKARSIDASFRCGNQKKLAYWVYDFMKHRNSSVHTHTRKSQLTAAVTQSVKVDYCRRLMTSYNSHILDPRYLLKMDETALYLSYSPNPTVHPKGQNTVSIMVGGSSSMRFTLAVTVAMDGTKLPLFVTLKSVPNGRVDKSLPDTIPNDVISYVQRKSWMYNRRMYIWYDYAYKTYVTGSNSHSGLLLDDFKFHSSHELLQAMEDGNAHRCMIPTLYIGLLQPCVVRINKPSKDRVKQKMSVWRRKKDTELRNGELMSLPSTKDDVSWIK